MDNIKIIFRNSLSWLLVLFYWAYLYRKTDHSATPFVLLFGITGFMGIYYLITEQLLNRRFFFSIISVFLLFGMINWGIVYNVSLDDIQKDIFFWGVTIVFFISPINYFKGIVAFYVSIVFFIDAFLSGSVVNQILSGASGNYISVLLIVFETIYFIGLNNSKRQLSVLDFVPPFISLLLSIWAVGRSGIISSALFLIMIVFVYFKQNNYSIGRKYKFLSFLFILLIIYILWNSIAFIEENNYLHKLEEKGLETSRYSMWNLYFEQMLSSPVYFLFGVPFEQVPIIHHINNNTHNSFLQLHAINGLIPFLLIFYFLFRSFVFYVKNNHEVLVVVLIVFVIRGFTDKFIFGEFGMPIFLYLILYPFAFKDNQNITHS